MNNKIQNVVTIVSAILSIIAIFMVWYKIDPSHTNWVSIEVGVLASLATVLIGWQIFTLINLKKLEENIRSKIKKEIDKGIDECKVSFNGEIALLRGHSWFSKAFDNMDEIKRSRAFAIIQII